MTRPMIPSTDEEICSFIARVWPHSPGNVHDSEWRAGMLMMIRAAIEELSLSHSVCPAIKPVPNGPSDEEIEREAIANADTDDEYRAFKNGAFFVQERMNCPATLTTPDPVTRSPLKSDVHACFTGPQNGSKESLAIPQPEPEGPSDRIISIAMATQECAFAWEPTARLIGNVCAEDIADLCGVVLALATTSEQIPHGPYSEHELRTQWNAQADEFNQWESLDLCEQLAWAQARAIAADRTRYARPAIKPVPRP